jgi:cytochrome c-type biogenesis protein CcmH
MSVVFVILALGLVIAVVAMAVSGAKGQGRVMLVSAAALTVLVFGAYALLGRPDLTRPKAASVEVLQARALAKMEETQAILARSADAKVEDWTELANQFWKVGSPAKAAEALAQAAKIAPTDQERDALLGGQAQALVSANNKQVGPTAQALFEGVLRRNPNDLRAMFFLGLAAEAAGDLVKTKAYWGRLIDIAPKDTPWRATLEARMQRMGKPPVAPAPNALGGLDAGQRQMVEGMVARLAGRLAKGDGTAQEWAQLGRSYVVLGKGQAALEAYEKAIALAPNDMRYQQARNAIAAKMQ